MKDKNAIWVKEDKKFNKFERNVKLPKSNLTDVNYVILKNKKDFEEIPKSKGVYWIWTNEPIKHILHKPSKNIPSKIRVVINKKKIKGEVIYNGIAQDNINNRIKSHHLQAESENGMSGISVDVYTGKNEKSHKKKILSKNSKGKVPYINNVEIKSKRDALKLFLSKTEKKFIKSKTGNILFRNGINIFDNFDNKHKKYHFVVFYIGNLKSESYMSFIEKQWRKEHKIYPRLCSYASGR